MKIVFMGTPFFAVETLARIQASQHKIVGVVTAQDKPAGRGKKIQSSAVKDFAEEKKLTIFQPSNLKNKEFLTEIENLNADIFVVVAFRMLPKILWEIPKFGTFNLHASLLPNYRGAAPINWVIVNGEEKTGVTSFFIDEEIDTGNILLQKSIELDPKETAGSLHDKLMLLSADLCIKTLEGIENQTIQPKMQKHEYAMWPAPKIQKNDLIINWNLSLIKIDCFVRGFSPFPTSFTPFYINDKEFSLKIFSGTFEVSQHKFQIGKIIIEKNQMKIVAKNGFFLPREVQLSGRRKLMICNFINGLNPKNEYSTIKR